MDFNPDNASVKIEIKNETFEGDCNFDPEFWYDFDCIKKEEEEEEVKSEVLDDDDTILSIAEDYIVKIEDLVIENKVARDQFDEISQSKFPVVLLQKLDVNINDKVHITGESEIDCVIKIYRSYGNGENCVVNHRNYCENFSTSVRKESIESEKVTEDKLETSAWEQEFEDVTCNDRLDPLLKDLKCPSDILSQEKWEQTGTDDSDDGYKCPLCQVKVKRKAGLRTHISTHLEVRDCKECDYRSVNKTDLEAHYLDEHSDSQPRRPKSYGKIYHAGFAKDKNFKCPICPYRSNRNWNVNSHLKIHSKIKPLQNRKYENFNKNVINDFVPLNANGDEISSPTRLPLPDKIADEEVKLSANTYALVSSSFNKVSPSTNLLLGKQYAEMESCSSVASAQVSSSCAHEDSNIVTSSYNLDLDVKTNESGSDLEKPVLLKCIQCSFTTNKQSILKEHISSHPGMKLFNCARCDFSTDQRWYFNAHILSHSSVEIFKCDKCDYMTNRKSSLKAHGLTHVSYKEFKCNHCSFETHNNRNLKTHLVIHSEEKIYKCSECDYESNVEKYLKTHSLVHCPEEQQYKCSECDYRTPRKGQLRIHSLKHTDIKLYKCLVCDFKTNRKCSLKVHSLSHSTQKLFKCTICKYDTNQKLLLRLHMLNHLNVKLYKCTSCDYGTNHSSHFKRHLKTHKVLFSKVS